jgi:hypothetical protein
MLGLLIIFVFSRSAFCKSQKYELRVHDPTLKVMEKVEDFKQVFTKLENLRGSGPLKIYGEFERQPGTKIMRASAGVQTSF